MDIKTIKSWIEDHEKPAEYRGKTVWQMSVPSADILMLLNELEAENKQLKTMTARDVLNELTSFIFKEEEAYHNNGTSYKPMVSRIALQHKIKEIRDRIEAELEGTDDQSK